MSTQTSPRLSSPLRDLISIRELERKFRRTRRSILRWVGRDCCPRRPSAFRIIGGIAKCSQRGLLTVTAARRGATK